jgi:hypothetical protein
MTKVTQDFSNWSIVYKFFNILYLLHLYIFSLVLYTSVILNINIEKGHQDISAHIRHNK